jgi:uncharacterized protein (TIGR00251 family)
MTEKGVVIRVRVTPRAARDEIGGWQDGRLIVRLRAPPVEGRANGALVRLLAERLDVAQAAIQIVGGATARSKRIRVEGLTPTELQRRLAASERSKG